MLHFSVWTSPDSVRRLHPTMCLFNTWYFSANTAKSGAQFTECSEVFTFYFCSTLMCQERTLCLPPPFILTCEIFAGQCKTESRGSKTSCSGLFFRPLECCLHCLLQPKLDNLNDYQPSICFYSECARCTLFVWLNVRFRVWLLQDHGQQRS